MIYSRYVGVANRGYGTKCWIGRVQVNKKIYRKSFITEIEAAKWVDEQSRKLFRVTKLNFPTEEEKFYQRCPWRLKKLVNFAELKEEYGKQESERAELS